MGKTKKKEALSPSLSPFQYQRFDTETREVHQTKSPPPPSPLHSSSTHSMFRKLTNRRKYGFCFQTPPRNLQSTTV